MMSCQPRFCSARFLRVWNMYAREGKRRERWWLWSCRMWAWLGPPRACDPTAHFSTAFFQTTVKTGWKFAQIPTAPGLKSQKKAQNKWETVKDDHLQRLKDNDCACAGMKMNQSLEVGRLSFEWKQDDQVDRGQWTCLGESWRVILPCHEVMRETDPCMFVHIKPCTWVWETRLGHWEFRTRRLVKSSGENQIETLNDFFFFVSDLLHRSMRCFCYDCSGLHTHDHQSIHQSP